MGIRPEGFIPDEKGVLSCELNRVEVMGRDTSVVALHPALTTDNMRAIVSSDCGIDTAKPVIKFSIKPHKLFIFDLQSEERLDGGCAEVQNEQ